MTNPSTRAGRSARDRWTWVALALLAFALRAWGLAAQSLWSDEDITLDRARLPLGELLANLPVEHPPGYFLLMSAWTRLAGDGDYALRFPSLVAGVLTVLFGGYVATRLVGRRAGWLTGLLLAVNPFLVWYGQEARMYAPLAALSLAALACVLHAETARRPLGWWVAAGVATALTVYTHYYGALLVLVLGAWAILDLVRRDRAATRGWLAAGATAALLFLPWLPRALGVFSFPGWREPQVLGDIPGIVLSAWSAGTTEVLGIAGWVTLLYVGLALVGMYALLRVGIRTDSVGAWRACLYFGLPLLAMTLVVIKTQDFHPRYFFAALPAFYLVVGAGAAALPRPAFGVAASLLVLAALPSLWGLYSGAGPQKPNYHPFLRAVEAAAGHEDTVLFLDGPSLGLARRYEVTDSPVKIVNIREDKGEPSPEAVAQRAAELAAEYPHLWLAENGDANGDIGRWLDSSAYRVDETHSFQDIRLTRYFAPPPATAESSAGLAEAPPGQPSGLALRGVPGSVTAGAVLPVQLEWAPHPASPWFGAYWYAASLRLAPEDDPSHVVAAADSPLAHGHDLPHVNAPAPEIDRRALSIPADLPPGKYRMSVVLYVDMSHEGGPHGEVGRWLGPSVTVAPAP
jgi:4-amino-4-deoxy-L-arabinose transferase-like glycosyltransferase